MPMDGTTLPPSMRHARSVSPLVCFSHLRWNSVFQRPQQIMSRFAQSRDVYFFEEPMRGEGAARLDIVTCAQTGVRVTTPMLPEGAPEGALRMLLDRLLQQIGPASAWYYTPLARAFSGHVRWLAVAFDCMDELSAFRFAPEELKRLEPVLMQAADVVFTGGASLHAARAHRHRNIHCFPSGVDLAHFMQARGDMAQPADQKALPRPVLGYFGVIDERLDMALLAQMAALRPDWHFAMLGPVAKLTPEELPQAANIHWLGPKDYRDLPSYLAHWDVALMPFARNEATRFISPTKAPEYLAGGRPVVSTGIADVMQRFAGIEAVAIADDAEGFVAAAARAMAGVPFDGVDDLLATMSWDSIQDSMAALLEKAESRSRIAAPALRTRPAPMADYLVVGAGFAGAVMAERLATAGQRVVVVDRRAHIGGNAFDEHDKAGLLVHRYGPHIFHTNSDDVLAYLSRFTAWRPYEHRVLASVSAGLVPMPINRTTLNRVFGCDLRTDAAAQAFLDQLASPVSPIVSARDFVVSAVGEELYEMFFRGYTLKQWGLDPRALDKSVTARVPTRVTDDDRYFLDKHQCMPRAGYTRMFENMLDHPNITVLLGTDHAQIPAQTYGHTVFTGPIDAWYGYRYGALPYRSLVFEHETLPVEFAQPVATVNYPDARTPSTRCTEFKRITGQVHRKTSLCREYPSDEGEPYYPVPAPENQVLYKKYEALADQDTAVTFLGRLGTYRYMNMDQVVGQALATARRMTAHLVSEAAE